MSWRMNLSWLITGMIWGLSVAQFLVPDEFISYQILCFTLALLMVDFAILVYVIHEGGSND